MSEAKPEHTNAQAGLDGAAPAAPGPADTSIDRLVAAALEAANAASSSIAPDHEAPPKADAPKAEADASQTDTEAAKPETAKPEAAKSEAARTPGELIIMPAADRAWHGDARGSKAQAAQGPQASGRRRVAAMAAVVVLAALAGALGGALATVGLAPHGAAEQASIGNGALESRIAEINAELKSLRARAESASKSEASQLNKTSERLDRLEKAQAEPNAKLAKLGEAVEKLRAAGPAAPATPAAASTASRESARETTGSIAPQSIAAATPGTAPPKPESKPEPKTEVARLPTVEGWVLRDVSRGGALIESRQGLYEVYAGDPVPGLGRIDAIRRQDGRWVVVTSRGLIVAR